MNNYCAAHSQFYSDYCAYCRPVETQMIVEKVYRTFEDGTTKAVILKVEGLIKLNESAEFFGAAVEITASKDPNIIVDIEKIDYMDSTGLGEFVGVCVKLARLGRNIVILEPRDDDQVYRPARFERLLRVAHAKDDIRVFESEEEALAAVVTSASEPDGSATP